MQVHQAIDIRLGAQFVHRHLEDLAHQVGDRHRRRVGLPELGCQPHVDAEQRLEVEPLGEGFWRVILRYGFMQDPDVPDALLGTRERGLALDPRMATYFLSRNTLVPSKRPGMAIWREHVFSFMQRNATRATQFYRIPPNRVVELGMQVEI